MELPQALIHSSKGWDQSKVVLSGGIHPRVGKSLPTHFINADVRYAVRQKLHTASRKDAAAHS